jgi:hypothetical protein
VIEMDTIEDYITNSRKRIREIETKSSNLKDSDNFEVFLGETSTRPFGTGRRKNGMGLGAAGLGAWTLGNTKEI